MGVNQHLRIYKYLVHAATAVSDDGCTSVMSERSLKQQTGILKSVRL